MASCTKEYTITLMFEDQELSKNDYKKYTILSINRLDLSKYRYIFKGWAETNGGKPLFKDTLWEVKADKTFYVCWKFNCRVSLYDNDVISWTYDREEGNELNLEDIHPQRKLEPDYVFKGWSLEQNGNEIVTAITVDQDTSLYSVWEQMIFKISFDLNGGTGVHPSDIQIKKGEYLYFASLPTSGFSYGVYTFEGWSKTKNGKVITSDFKPDQDITLYAVWSHNGQVKDKTDDE